MKRIVANGAKKMICYLQSIQILPVAGVGSATIRGLTNSDCYEEITPTCGRYSSNGIKTAPLHFIPTGILFTTLIFAFKPKMRGEYRMTVNSDGKY